MTTAQISTAYLEATALLEKLSTHSAPKGIDIPSSSTSYIQDPSQFKSELSSDLYSYKLPSIDSSSFKTDYFEKSHHCHSSPGTPIGDYKIDFGDLGSHMNYSGGGLASRPFTSVQHTLNTSSLGLYSSEIPSYLSPSHAATQKHYETANVKYTVNSPSYSPSHSPSHFVDTKEYKPEIKEVVTFFEFLSRVKALDHVETNKLFGLANPYSHVRSFVGSQQSLFIALSFAFFEKFLLQDLSLTKRQDEFRFLDEILSRNIEISSDPAYKQLISDLKRFIDLGDMFDGRHLYESICSTGEIYEASLKLFSEILKKTLQTISSFGNASFKWMNEIPLADTTFYQEIANTLQASLKVYLLTSIQLEHKTFFKTGHSSTELSHSTMNPKDLDEIVVLIDKRYNACYLLYSSKEQRKSFSGTSIVQPKLSQNFDFMNTMQRKSSSRMLTTPVVLSRNTSTEEDRRLKDLLNLETIHVAGNSLDFSPLSFLKKKSKEKLMISNTNYTDSHDNPFSLRETKSSEPVLTNQTTSAFEWSLTQKISDPMGKSNDAHLVDILKEIKSYNTNIRSSEDKFNDITSTNPNDQISLGMKILSEFTTADSSVELVKEQISTDKGATLNEMTSLLQGSLLYTPYKTADQILKEFSSTLASTSSANSTSYSSASMQVTEPMLKEFILKEKAIPSSIKEKFISCNEEVQKNDKELSNMTNRYLSKESKKTEVGRMLLVNMKYKSIIQKRKQNQGTSYLGTAMKMDSN